MPHQPLVEDRDPVPGRRGELVLVGGRAEEAVDGADEGLAREDADALLGDAAERVGVPQGPDVRVDGSVARALFVVRAGGAPAMSCTGLPNDSPSSTKCLDVVSSVARCAGSTMNAAVCFGSNCTCSRCTSRDFQARVSRRCSCSTRRRRHL